jgi:uncharacterized protein
VNILIGFGQILHRRYVPRENSFSYRTYFLMLPMRSIDALRRKNGLVSSYLSWNKFGAISFYDKDHGDARGSDAGGALSWIEELLASEGIDDVDGEIWLHTYPRVWGYSFKPVSFWYCHAANGSLRAIVVEVNNTFGERHFYLIKDPVYARDLYAQKSFHVSPFCKVEGSYLFRFLRTTPNAQEKSKTVVRIDYKTAQGLLIHTSVSGALEPLNSISRRRALISYPLMTVMIITRIHWQALKLWFIKTPFHSKPPQPSNPITLVSKDLGQSGAKS